MEEITISKIPLEKRKHLKELLYLKGLKKITLLQLVLN